MDFVILIGNLGSSLIHRLIAPITHVAIVRKISVISRYPSTKFGKLVYYCPPIFINRFALTAIIYELLILFYLCTFKKPDYVIGYRIFPHGLIASIAAKFFRLPFIISIISGPYELYAMGTRIGIKYTNPLPFVGRLFLNMLKNAQAIITTGSFTNSFLINHGIENSKIFPINEICPPHLHRFHPIELPKIYDVISVARLSPEKRIEVLLYAISLIRERGREIRVCILGDGPCESKLKKLVGKLNLANNVDFIGFQQNVEYYYNSAKMLVLTSEREGNPTVFLEAMKCGIPSIVSNCGDIMDIAQDGFNCLVVQKYNNIDGFAQAIVKLLDDNNLYSQLSRNSLETVNSFSMEKATQAWQSLLDIVIASK